MNFAKVWKRYLHLPIVVVGVCALVMTACVYMRRHGLFERLELRVYDKMLSWHLQPREYSASNDIVVIGIDEDDLEALGHYPLTDDDKAQLFKELATTYQAGVIGLDIFLDIPVGNDEDGTRRLKRVLGTYRNIIGLYEVGSGSVEQPEINPPRMQNPRNSDPAVARGEDPEIADADARKTIARSELEMIERNERAMTDASERPMIGRRAGFNDQPFDHDELCRIGLLYLSDAPSGPDPSKFTIGGSLSLDVANQYLEAHGVLHRPDPNRPEEKADPMHITSFWQKKLRRFEPNDGGYANRDAGGFLYLVDYRGESEYSTLRLRQVVPGLFDPDRLKALPARSRLPVVADPTRYKGKVILVGMTARSVKDYIATPIHPEPGPRQFGVFHHAVLIDQLIRAARDGSVPVAVWSENASWAWAGTWAIIGAALGLTARIGFSTRAPWRLLFIAVAGEIALVGITAVAFHRGVWIQLLAPSFCYVTAMAIVGAYVAQLARADRNTLNSIFVRICQKEVANELWKRRDELLDNGRLRPRKLMATLMFGDLKGFSTACEGLDPAQVIEWVNQYHQTMTSIVTRYHGVIVRYMGDGMMAVFGAPSASQNERQFPVDARDAVNCALQMRRELADLHDTWRARGLPCLAMRVGIHTGIVVEGSVGSASRFEYVTLGDTTNTASRLETHDKTLMDPDVAAGGCRILIGEPTYQYVQGHVQVRCIGEIPLDGKKNMLKVYGVTGPAEPAPPSSQA